MGVAKVKGVTPVRRILVLVTIAAIVATMLVVGPALAREITIKRVY